MRVDVFLKQSRLVKRRSLAKELCDDGAIALNGRAVRAGREVTVGDLLTLSLRRRRIEVEIVDVPKRPPSAAAAIELYLVLSDERIENED